MVSDKLENIIEKLNNKGFTTVSKFLNAKARKSRRTAKTFSFSLDKFNDYIIKRYNGKYDIQTILPVLLQSNQSKNKNKERIDVYDLIDAFINYLQTETRNGPNLTPKTISVYITAVKSYLQYNDVDILSAKFKNKVVLPTLYRTDEAALDANDIRVILNNCSNRRLKAYLLVLASGGMRAVEALSLRTQDLDFSGINFADLNDKSEPAGVTIRQEYSKTKTERKIFISNEAARFLHDWIELKYRNKPREKEDLIFSKILYIGKHPIGLYDKILEEFQKVLQLSGPALAARKEGGVFNRRRYTLHSFRRYLKTIIANQVNTDNSEWFLGHKKSPYYTDNDEVLKNTYKEKCMKYLTFLDYPTLAASVRSVEDKLAQKDREIEELKRRERENEEKIEGLYNGLKEVSSLVASRLGYTKEQQEEDMKETRKWIKAGKTTDEIRKLMDGRWRKREREIEEA